MSILISTPMHKTSVWIACFLLWQIDILILNKCKIHQKKSKANKPKFTYLIDFSNTSRKNFGLALSGSSAKQSDLCVCVHKYVCAYVHVEERCKGMWGEGDHMGTMAGVCIGRGRMCDYVFVAQRGEKQKKGYLCSK